MRLVGDLVLAGFGQIKNARIDNVSSDPASPQVGQVWYNTTDGKYRGYDGNSVITFATGGSTAILQQEIDAIESAAGLSAEGAYVAPTGSNYLGSTTTLAGADSALDTAVKGVSDAVATEQTRATAAEGTLTAAVAAETTRATAAEGTIAANLSAETTRATAAEGSITSALNAETTRATAAEGSITSALNAETTRATAAEGTLTANLSAEVTRATAEEQSIRDALQTEVDRATTAESDLASNFNAKLAGLTWKNSVRAISMSNIALSGEKTVDGVSLIAGDRVLVNGQTDGAENGIYVVASGAWSRATDMDATTPLNEFNSAAVFVEAGNTYSDTGWTEVLNVSVVGTDAVSFTQFNGAAGITAGIGMDKNGNTLLVKADGSSITVSASGIKLSTALQTEISNATADILTEKTRAQAAEQTLTTDLATEVTRATAQEASIRSEFAAADATELTRAQAQEASIRSEFAAADAAEQTRATAAELTLRNDLSAEVTRATGVETTLRSDLNAEITRATGAETTINDRITASQYVYEGTVAATSHTVNHNLGQKYGQVVVVDSNDKVIIPDAITFNSNNQLTVDFISAITCKVVYSAPKL